MKAVIKQYNDEWTISFYSENELVDSYAVDEIELHISSNNKNKVMLKHVDLQCKCCGNSVVDKQSGLCVNCWLQLFKAAAFDEYDKNNA